MGNKLLAEIQSYLNKITLVNGVYVYSDGKINVELFRYTDPHRINLADSSAVYLGKSDTDNTRRPLSIMRLGHALEVFRGESATFKFNNVDKVVYDHLVTYKTMQMRIAGGNRALISTDYSIPSDKIKDSTLVDKKIRESLDAYKTLINAGETPQVARYAMPVGVHMNTFKLQFNFQTLIESLFVQRIWEHGAQGNTVHVVKAMFALCYKVDAELWSLVHELYGEHTKEWKEASKKLRKQKTTVAEFLKELSDADALVSDMTLDEYIRTKYGGVKNMW